MKKISDISESIGKRGLISAWVRLTVKNKKIVFTLIFLLFAAGISGLVKMNKNEFPEFDIKLGLVAGIYPGADAQEVEERLTKPLEEFLFSFKEVDRETLSSVSMDGICYLFVDLNIPQKKKDEVWSKIKLALQVRQKTLPPGVLGVAVLDEYSNCSSMLLALQSEDKSYSDLQSYAERLCGNLRELPELAAANILGSQTEEIAVTLDREKLSKYGLDPSSIFLKYQSEQLQIPSGTFETSYTTSPIRVENPAGNEREIAESIVYSDPLGSIIRLEDIADIERRYKKPESIVSYNGTSCLIVNIEMRPGNNIIAFGRNIETVLEEFRQTIPDSVTVSRISDQPKFVRDSIWSFLRDLVIAILVVIFVMLMLFPMRSALIAGSGVPVCTAIAVALMYLSGIELNTVTLGALIVCLGMIVDDSIITMDGYMEKNRRGLHGIDAASASAQELFKPTFIATLAICLMFCPMLGILDGYLGDFVKPFPWIILFSLMTSLFYAVSVVPSLEIRFLKPETATKRKNFFARGQERFFCFMQNSYEKALAVCFKHPKLTISGGILAVGLGILMFSRTNIMMFPNANRDYFVVEMYLQDGCGLDKTRERSDSLTRLLLQDPRVKSVTAFAGESAPRFSATYNPLLPSETIAQLLVNTTSYQAVGELLSEYTSQYENIFPDTQIHFKQIGYQAVNTPICVIFTGNSREDMEQPVEKVKTFLRSRPDTFTWVHCDNDRTIPGVKLEMDADEASRLGVNKALLSLSLAGTFNAQNVATLWEGGSAVPVNLYSEGVDGDVPYTVIGDRMVATSIPGVSVPLRQVADVKPVWKKGRYDRTGGSNVISVSAELRPGKSQPPSEKEVKRFIDKEVRPTLPEGIEISYGGFSASNNACLPKIFWSFAGACAVLFLFLMLHFGKASIAALTMLISSLCLFGSSFGLWIFNLDFSITAVLGLISLVGIIVRNGILMFEYAENARFNGGESVYKAAMDAGKRRMRPIFLTSCTTALGVLPMILSGDLLWMPMGVVICFGTLMSIFLVVLIMPVVYWQIFKNK